MKQIIITGACGQVGRAFIQHLDTNHEYEILALDKNISEESNSSKVKYFQVDITNEQDVLTFFEKNVMNLSVTINNAGAGVFTPFLDRSVKEFSDVMNVNLLGTFLMCRESVKKMIPKNGGKIINIGSIYGVVSSDYRIYGDSKRNNSEIYSMTKAGVIMLSKYMAANFSHYNIQCNTISPGGIERNQNDFFKRCYIEKNPSQRMAQTEDLLPALDYLISESNNYVTGQNLIIDGGFTAW